MMEPLIVTAFPVVFLVLLFGGGAALRRRQIDMDGTPPIDRKLFLLSKLAMFVPWAAMILQSFGLNLSPLDVPRLLKWISLGLWVSGFSLLLAGRLGMGNSFRIGCAKESTNLKVGGLFRYSRNPMYLGIYGTLLASALFTMNPLILLLGVFVTAVHHRIVLGEEACLRRTFGEEYADYCRRVKRYL